MPTPTVTVSAGSLPPSSITFADGRVTGIPTAAGGFTAANTAGSGPSAHHHGRPGPHATAAVSERRVVLPPQLSLDTHSSPSELDPVLRTPDL